MRIHPTFPHLSLWLVPLFISACASTPLIDPDEEGLSPRRAKRIEDQIAKLENAARYDYGHSWLEIFNNNSSATRLIRIGPPAIPFLVQAMHNDELPWGRRLNAMRVVAEIGKKHKVDVLDILCEAGRHWTDPPDRYALAASTASEIELIGSPEAVTCLLDLVRRGQPWADLFYSPEVFRNPIERVKRICQAWSTVGRAVRGVCSIAQRGEDEAQRMAREAVEEFENNDSISIRTAAAGGIAIHMPDKEEALQFLEQRIARETKESEGNNLYSLSTIWSIYRVWRSMFCCSVGLIHCFHI